MIRYKQYFTNLYSELFNIIYLLLFSQNEFRVDQDKRVQFVSGFTGSAGTVVITKQDALLWTDSRYFLQAGDELDSQHWTLMKEGI